MINVSLCTTTEKASPIFRFAASGFGPQSARFMRFFELRLLVVDGEVNFRASDPGAYTPSSGEHRQWSAALADSGFEPDS